MFIYHTYILDNNLRKEKVTRSFYLGLRLGPLLFIIYINDFSQASQLFNFVMYADDTTLSTSLNYLSETTLDNKSTETIINEELCKN